MTRRAERVTGRGYHTPPDGGRREALPRLQGRPDQGKGARPRRARADGQSNGRDRASEAPPAALAGAAGSRSPLSRSSCCSSSGSCSATSPFRGGVEEANERLPKTVEANLAPQDGLLISKPTQILLLGTDGDRTRPRGRAPLGLDHARPHRSRTATGIAYLSIPRDLRVEIPGHGANKINAAFQLGGPGARAARRSREFTGLQPNHVVIVDFDDFKAVIDALGGVTVDVPKPILSNKLRLPVRDRRALRALAGLALRQGRAARWTAGARSIYSRIRQNRLDPAENDLTRGAPPAGR